MHSGVMPRSKLKLVIANSSPVADAKSTSYVFAVANPKSYAIAFSAY